MINRILKGSQLLLALLLLVSCVTSPTGRKQFMIISPERAIAESQKAYISTVQELDEGGQLHDDSALADRVALITGHIVTEAVKIYPHVSGWQWSVVLIDEPETINAWCMAGGRMGVYSGLFEELQLTDDEFAQIMGHEISHALANHTAERMSVAMMSGLASSITKLAKPDEDDLQTGVELLAALALELPNSRTSEREADQMGTELAALAGYKPGAVLTLWEKMENAGGSSLPDFLSTHPSPANRRAELAQLVPALEAIRPDKFPAPHPVDMIYDDTPDGTGLMNWLPDW